MWPRSQSRKFQLSKDCTGDFNASINPSPAYISYHLFSTPKVPASPWIEEKPFSAHEIFPPFRTLVILQPQMHRDTERLLLQQFSPPVQKGFFVHIRESPWPMPLAAIAPPLSCPLAGPRRCCCFHHFHFSA